MERLSWEKTLDHVAGDPAAHVLPGVVVDNFVSFQGVRHLDVALP
jgi:hypothetical protein